MQIKYVGPKDVKTVFGNHDTEKREYVFSEESGHICEINPLLDKNILTFLLSPDRGGMFIVVDKKGAEAPKETPKAETPKKKRGSKKEKT